MAVHVENLNLTFLFTFTIWKVKIKTEQPHNVRSNPFRVDTEKPLAKNTGSLQTGTLPYSAQFFESGMLQSCQKDKKKEEIL